MAYFQIVVNTPYCGTEQEEYIECQTMAEATLFAEDLCQSNAESYEYLVSGWDDENFEDMTEEEQTEEIEEYYSNCSWYVDEITKEEYFKNIL